MIRVTAECSAIFARFTIQEADEKNRRLLPIADGLTLRDMAKLGFERRDLEHIWVGESRDFTTPSAETVRDIVARLGWIASKPRKVNP